MDSLSPRDYTPQELPFLFHLGFIHVLEGCQCSGKKCTKCQEVKCRGAFSRDTHASDGLVFRCKHCKADYLRTYVPPEPVRERKKSYMKTYGERHKEQKKAYNKAYGQSHAEQIHAQKKAYRETHLEEIRAKNAAWQRSHRDYKQNYNRSYRQKHRDILLSRHREYYLSHADEMKWSARHYELTHREEVKARKRAHREANYAHYAAKDRAYKQANRERVRLWMKVCRARRRAMQMQTGGSYTVQEWQALKEHYQYTCLCCGRREPDIKLTADHIVPVTRHGSSFISNIQPLCGSCNSKKHRKIIDYRGSFERKSGETHV